MTGRGGRRAVSTVVDVSLALMLVSASVVTLTFFMTGTERTHDPRLADQTADTLAGVTVTTEYDLEPITDPIQDDPGRDDPFDDDPYGPSDYERTKHGPILSQLADATVIEARFPDGDDSTLLDPSADPERLTRSGVDYRKSLQGTIRNALTDADQSAHVVALWRPYEGSAIEGRVEVGQTPPAGGDYSTSTITLSSDMPPLRDSEVERAFRRGGIPDVADLVARSIIRGYFPPGETQLALERNGFERDLVVYRYQRMAEVLDARSNFDDTTPAVTGRNYLSQTQANARELNSDLETDLSLLIEEDLRELRDDEYGGSFEAETLADVVRPGDVTITVYTWNE
ncbi:hypothetical protein [Halosimplex sp. TS25]|uniref:DUF7284 family protein n=1 Tax=Halosimplex rarum TaxID=3396619 RepID=UPI0039EC6BEF